MFSYMSYLHPVSAKLRQQTALSSSSPNIQNGQITRKLTKKFFRLSHPAEICERCLSCALISSGNCRSLLYYFPFSVSFIPDWQKHKSDCFPNPQNIHKYQPVWVPQPIPLFAPNGEVIRLSAEVQFNWNTKVGWSCYIDLNPVALNFVWAGWIHITTSHRVCLQRRRREWRDDKILTMFIEGSAKLWKGSVRRIAMIVARAEQTDEGYQQKIERYQLIRQDTKYMNRVAKWILRKCTCKNA